METQQIHDDEISRRYLAGEHALAIAGELNLRAAEVIGRIRALGLLPAGMAERRPAPALQPPSSPRPARIAATRPVEAREQTETEATETSARARPPVRRPAKPASARPSVRHPIDDVFDDDD